AASLGSYLDGVLRLSDQSGKLLAQVDDVALPAPPGQPALVFPDPFLEYTVPPGVNLLVVGLHDRHLRGGINYGYRLTIEPAVPDFLVSQPVAEVNVPRGGSAALTVPVTRRGYTGPVQLTIPKPPAGLTVQGGYVPEGGSYGVLTLTAGAQAQAPQGLW